MHRRVSTMRLAGHFDERSRWYISDFCFWPFKGTHPMHSASVRWTGLFGFRISEWRALQGSAMRKLKAVILPSDGGHEVVSMALWAWHLDWSNASEAFDALSTGDSPVKTPATFETRRRTTWSGTFMKVREFGCEFCCAFWSILENSETLCKFPEHVHSDSTKGTQRKEQISGFICVNIKKMRKIWNDENAK